MLNHKQCDAFLAVAETGSFDLAAEQLCITASAVTLRIQSLEKSLGHLLIVREDLAARHKQVNHCCIICNIADC
ncbi:putative HTH-type transcriptional regulator [compost metagenome]